MYKSIKVSDEAYKEAKSLSRELEKSGEFPGVHKVNLSEAVGYALKKTSEDLKDRRRFLSAAGGWNDMENIDMLAADLRRSRKSRKSEVGL